MKYALLILLIVCSVRANAQKADTSLRHINGSSYYLVSGPGNTRVIVFLHGGVSNPVFTHPKEIPSLDFLLEGNTAFIPAALRNGFDVVLPIKDDSLNWLSNHEYCFKIIDKMINAGNSHTHRYIAGFSDGGTGSYRIFYGHQNYFDGLAVCNGYPQLQNFNKTVEYNRVADKKVLFLSTTADATIPYEFLLIEYCRQKKHNPDTYFYLAAGSHSFSRYSAQDISQLFSMLTTLPDNTKTIATHAYIRHDTVTTFYPFRKSTLRKFNYGREFYEENLRQAAAFK